jgi:hypothetical protein
MGKYYTKAGVIREMAIVIGLVLLIAVASATVYFGAFTREEIPAAPVENITVELEPLPTPTLTPTPEPTPRPKNETGYNIGEWYQWHRANVSGLKDMDVKVTVYNYRFMDGYTWHADSLGRDLLQPAPAGSKYLFVFANLELQGARYYVGEPWSRFKVQIKDKYIIEPDTEYVKGILIRELEDTYDLNHVQGVQSFGYLNTFLQNIGRWTAITPLTLREGKSNSWDGYIIFVVPADTKPEDITVLSQWDTFGTPFWRLTQ